MENPRSKSKRFGKLRDLGASLKRRGGGGGSFYDGSSHGGGGSVAGHSAPASGTAASSRGRNLHETFHGFLSRGSSHGAAAARGSSPSPSPWPDEDEEDDDGPLDARLYPGPGGRTSSRQASRRAREVARRMGGMRNPLSRSSSARPPPSSSRPPRRSRSQERPSLGVGGSGLPPRTPDPELVASDEDFQGMSDVDPEDDDSTTTEEGVIEPNGAAGGMGRKSSTGSGGCDDASQVSDGDYYRQDYFMLGEEGDEGEGGGEDREGTAETGDGGSRGRPGGAAGSDPLDAEDENVDEGGRVRSNPLEGEDVRDASEVPEGTNPEQSSSAGTNPFGDGYDDERKAPEERSKKSSRDRTNPFDDEDDDEKRATEEQVKTSIGSVPQQKQPGDRGGAHPFEDDGGDDNDEREMSYEVPKNRAGVEPSEGANSGGIGSLDGTDFATAPKQAIRRKSVASNGPEEEGERERERGHDFPKRATHSPTVPETGRKNGADGPSKGSDDASPERGGFAGLSKQATTELRHGEPKIIVTPTKGDAVIDAPEKKGNEITAAPEKGDVVIKVTERRDEGIAPPVKADEVIDTSEKKSVETIAAPEKMGEVLAPSTENDEITTPPASGSKIISPLVKTDATIAPLVKTDEIIAPEAKSYEVIEPPEKRDAPLSPSTTKENAGPSTQIATFGSKQETAKIPKMSRSGDQKQIVEDISKLLHEEETSPTVYVSSTKSSHPPTNKAMAKLLKENKKLLKARKEALDLLSLAAQQFSAHEQVCAQKISELEEKNRQLAQKPREISDIDFASFVSEELERSNSDMSNSTKAKMYNGEVVRRLSNGVLMQEKQLKSKDELIAQLKMQCEEIKQSVVDKEDEHLSERNIWEQERAELLKTLGSSSPMEEIRGELLAKKMECSRLQKELDAALSDINMLTTALETNNKALDAAVLELDKHQGGGVPDGSYAAVAEKLRSELKEKDEETSRLQKDLESSLGEIEELRHSVNLASSAGGYGEFQDVVEDLKKEADSSRKDADLAKDRIRQLELELEAKKGEMDKLRITPLEQAPSSNLEDFNGGADPMAGVGKRWGSGLRRAFGGAAADKEEEQADFSEMLKQRDDKIQSLDTMRCSYLKIIDKMKADIERMDNDREEAEYKYTRRIQQLEEENKTYEIQVVGYENEKRGRSHSRSSRRIFGRSHSGSSRQPKQDDESEVVEDHIWDEHDHDADVRSENMTLQRSVQEFQSQCSFQEDQIEKLKADLIRLRVTSQQEKDTALARVAEEKEIVVAQRSALEEQLVEINKSAGALRETLDGSGCTPDAPGDRGAGSDPTLVTQVVMLEKANKVLEANVKSLRSGTQEKLAPLLERIALLEEEQRIAEEEMNTKLSCREMTINNLENSLKQLKGGQRKLKFSKKKGLKLSKTPSSPSDAPDKAAGGH